MAGLTESGFTKKTLAEIREELEDAFRSIFGSFLNLLPATVESLLIGIFAERASAIWDMAEEVYASQYPDTAEGASLDGAVAYTGTRRLGAEKSTQPNQLFFGEVGTVIPTDTQLSVEENPDAIFVPTEEITLVAGANAQQTIDFDTTPDEGSFKIVFRGEETAAIAFDDTAQDVEDAINALDIAAFFGGVVVTGSFATMFTIDFEGDDGLQEQPIFTYTDNTLETSNTPVVITIAIVEAGTPQGIVELEAVETGSINAPIGTLNVIDTPVSGLTRTINTEVAVLGRDRETDAELKIRRANTLAGAGNATVEAIRARLLNVTGVVDVFIFENLTLVTDINGRPGKSYECVIGGGDDDEIAEVIWLSKPAGVQTYGSEDVVITDSLGDPRTVYFSRPDPVPVYFSIDLTVDEDLFPVDGDALAKTAIIDWGNELGIGTDVVVYPTLISQLSSIPGILDVIIRVDDAAVSTTPEDPAVDDNIEIAAFEVSEWSELNGDVNIL